MTITFTKKAQEKIKALLLENLGNYVRIGCSAGGCNGFSYLIKVEKNKKSDDICLTVDGIEVIIDDKSVGLLDGLNIDYSTHLNNIGFVYNNPNAKQTCGCGLSFTI